jgi:hypothetical protein
VLTCRLADGKAHFGCSKPKKAFKKLEKANIMIKKQRTAKQKVVNDKNLNNNIQKFNLFTKGKSKN